MNPQTITAPPEIGESLALVVEDLARRFEDGEAIDIEAIIARHPEHEAALRQLLPAMAALAHFGNSNGAALALDPLAGAADETGRLGDFRIIRELGRGGMGVVYEAEQISLGRRVALKVLPFAGVLDERQLKRFKLEAAAAGALKHPGIVSVYCVGCERGVHFYAMEYVEGQSLAAVILECGNSLPLSFSNNGDNKTSADSRKRSEQAADQTSSATDVLLPGSRRIEKESDDKSSHAHDTIAAALSTLHTTRPRDFFRRVAELGIQAADALEHAHQMGIVHRDIKPANLLLDNEGKLSITDFGLARLSTDAGMTLTGDMLGTLRYMSPEQASGAKLLDERTDIYSLGVTLYELLALRPAFDERDRQKLIRQVVEQDPPRLRSINPRIPADLDSILVKALAKDPAERYRSATELSEDLRRFLTEQPIKARRPTLWQQAMKWCRRHPAWVSAVVVTCLIATVVLAVATALVLQSHASAIAERTRAEANFALARRAVDEMYTRVASDVVAGYPHSTGLKRDILERALVFYQELTAANNDLPLSLRDRGQALLKISYITSDLGQYHRSEAAAREALDIFAELVKLPDATSDDWLSLGRAWICHGYGLGNFPGERDNALAAIEQAVATLEEAVRRYPADTPCRDDLARRTNDLANALSHRQRFDEAERAYERVSEIIQQVVQSGGTATRYRQTRAFHAKDFGNFLIARRPLQAESMLREAIRLFAEIATDNPTEPFHVHFLNNSRGNLARLLQQTGRADGAVQFRRDAMADARKLVDDYPTMPGFRAHLVSLLRSEIPEKMKERNYDAAETICRQVIAQQEQLALITPDKPMEQALAGSHKQLETILAKKQQAEQASAAKHDPP